MKSKDFRLKLERKKGAKETLIQEINNLRISIKKSKRSIRHHEHAREIMREVGNKTQKQLQYHISDITTLALEAVFDDPYTLKVDFILRRNKTECDLIFKRGEMEIDPLESSGGGAVDIASFALRVASWSMSQNKIRNTIILDEPLRFLSADKQEKASKMIKELSDKLGIQFIFVTHETILTEYADNIIPISKEGKFSKIKI